MEIFSSAKEFNDLCLDVAGKAESIRIQVKGGSMEPIIKSGDWINIELFGDQKPDIRKGEVILFRRGNGHCMHRVIRTGPKGIETKGDMCFRSDGVVSSNDIVGKAISVERKGLSIGLDPYKGRISGALIADIFVIVQFPLLCIRISCRLGRSLFSHVQGFKIYRAVIKKIIKVPVIVRDAKADDEGELRDLYLMAGHDIRDGITRIKGEGYWLVAERNSKVVGGLTISKYEKNSLLWVIFGLEVKARFRGLGIGEELVRKALQKAGDEGATEIGLFVNKKSTPAIKLYEKLGFNATDDFPRDFNRSQDELYLSFKLRQKV